MKIGVKTAAVALVCALIPVQAQAQVVVEVPLDTVSSVWEGLGGFEGLEGSAEGSAEGSSEREGSSEHANGAEREGSSERESSSERERETVGDSNLTGWEIALIVLAAVILAPPLLIHLFYAVL